MRLKTAVLAMLVAGSVSASAAPRVVLDWGLHRAWRVEIDPAHPERPARLVEISWRAGQVDHAAAARGENARATPEPPLVRAGMQVTVIRRGATAEIRLRGTALGAGCRNAAVPVRAGLGGAVLRGIVRGPGVVELVPEKGR